MGIVAIRCDKKDHLPLYDITQTMIVIQLSRKIPRIIFATQDDLHLLLSIWYCFNLREIFWNSIVEI